MIAVISNKNDKNIDKKLTNFLESNNFKVWNRWRDTQGKDPFDEFKNLIDNFSAIIFIFSNSILHDPQIKKFYDILLDKNITPILFLISKPADDLTTWYFLENHEYIKAYQVSFEQAAQALIELLNEIKSPQTLATEVQQTENKPEKNKNLNLILYAILALTAILVIFFVSKRPKHSNTQTTAPTSVPITFQKQNLSPEQLLIGTWKMNNYSDNIVRQGQDLINFQKAIAQLKQNFELTFKPNHTFIRKGFSPQPETGFWEYDPQTKTLTLSTSKNKAGDKLKILTLNQKQLIFEVASPDPKLGTIIVRFNLYRSNSDNQSN